MISIRLEDEKGKKRLYEFEQDEIRIGFRAGTDISLSPQDGEGGELRIRINEDGGYILEPVGNAGSFRLNEEQIQAPVPVTQGAVISHESYSLTIEKIEAVPVGDESEADDKKKDSAPESEESAEIPEQAPQIPVADDKSYLLLFLEPVREFLEDDDVSEVLINGPNQIYIERKGKLSATSAKFLNEQALQAAVRNIARHVGRRFDEDEPRLDARLPDGSRIHAVMPPLARSGTVVAIRKFSREKLTMPQLVKFGSISEEGAGLIEVIVKLHKNVIISGPTSSGKTSVLNVLSGFISNDERILVIEDASELQLQQEHVVCFETRKPDEHGKGEVGIRDLVHSSLRLRPDRLVVGEIRGAEALDLLQALNTGHAGSMTTIHANGPKDALSRLETCALFSGIDIPMSALREQVTTAVNIVIHTARLTDGSRKITHVSEVLGLEDGEYRLQDLLIYKVDRVEKDGRLIGRHVGAGAVPTFMDEAEMRGIPLVRKWFKQV